MLSSQELVLLSTHLNNCIECAAYANEISEVTSILPPMLKRQWDVQPIPLSIAALTGRNEKIKSNNSLTMRTASVSLVMMLLFFSVWQFVVSGSSGTIQIPASIPPAPTPSSVLVKSTSTQRTLEGCEIVPYVVQENDTLASIASQFSTSEDMILKFNTLDSNVVHPAMELLLPICLSTPTGTFYPATFTTTYTPVLNYTPSSPGG